MRDSLHCIKRVNTHLWKANKTSLPSPCLCRSPQGREEALPLDHHFPQMCTVGYLALPSRGCEPALIRYLLYTERQHPFYSFDYIPWEPAASGAGSSCWGLAPDAQNSQSGGEGGQVNKPQQRRA